MTAGLQLRPRDRAPGREDSVQGHSLSRWARIAGACACLLATATCHGGSIDLRRDVLPPLEILSAKPLDRDTLINVRYLAEAADDADPEVKAGLTTIFGLGQIALGEAKDGAATCARVATLKKSDFAALAAKGAPGGAANAEAIASALREAIRRTADCARSVLERGEFDHLKLSLVCEGVSRGTVAEPASPAVTNFIPAALSDPVAAAAPPSGASYNVNLSQATLLDALARASRRPGFAKVALDPDLVAFVAGIKAPLGRLDAVTNAAALDAAVDEYGLTAEEVSLGDSMRVTLVTTPSALAYGSAVLALRDGLVPGALTKAQAALRSGRKLDNTPYSLHAAGLSDALKAVQALSASIDECRATAREAVRLLATAQRSLEAPLTKSPFKMQSPELTGQIGGKAAAHKDTTARLYEGAQKNLTVCMSRLAKAYEDQARAFSVIAARCNEAYAARLTAEARFLLQCLLSGAEQMRSSTRELQESCGQMHKTCLGIQQNPEARPSGSASDLLGVVQDALKDVDGWSADLARLQTSHGYLPAAGPAWEKVLVAQLAEAGGASSSGFRQLSTDKARAAAALAEAVAADRSSVPARAALGYCDLRLQAESLERAFSRAVTRPTITAAWSTELQQLKKDSYRIALHEVTYGASPRGPELATACLRPGTSQCPDFTGAAAVSVGIDPLAKRTPVIPAAVATRWKEIAFDRAANLAGRSAFTIGDFEPEDARLWINLGQALPWLVNSVKGKMEGIPEITQEENVVVLTAPKGLVVRFSDLAARRRLDEAAGAAVGLAAAALGSGTNLSARVAAVGALGPDGSIRRVRRVTDLVRGALAAPGVEVLLVPRANEADLMLLPPDALCRLAIVLVESVDAGLPYAADPAFRRDMLHRLARAQLRFASGRIGEAVPDLADIASSAPEIYPARRLLELAAYCAGHESKGP